MDLLQDELPSPDRPHRRIQIPVDYAQNSFSVLVGKIVHNFQKHNNALPSIEQ